MLTTVTLALLFGLFGSFLLATPAVGLPNGFQDRLVTDVPSPTALDFTPDGRRMLVASKSSQLRVFSQDGEALASPALNLGPAVCDNSERGLLGVVVDPDFGANHYIYLYYTYRKFVSVRRRTP